MTTAPEPHSMRHAFTSRAFFPAVLHRFAILVLSFLLGCASVRRSFAEGLEDAPYVPTPAVIQGTIRALTDPHETVVLAAIQDLSEWRAESAAAEMQKLLTDGTSKTIRADAFHFFVTLGPKAKAFLPALVPYLKDAQPGVRERVVDAIAAAGAAADYQDAVLPMLADSRKEVRVAAARCIGKAGKAAKAHRDALLKALARAGSAEFKSAIMDALTEIGDLPPVEAEKLLPFLADREGDVRIAASAAIFNALIDAKAAGDKTDFSAIREKMMQRFRKEPPEIRGAILKHAITDAETARLALEGVAKELEELQPEPRKAALFALGMAGEAAIPQVASVVAQFKAGDAELKAAALAALRGIGAKAVEPNMELVVRALLDSSEAVRAEALLTLPLCGATLKKRPFKMLDVFPTASPEVRDTLLKAAAAIILTLGGDEESLDRALKAFEDPSPDNRIAASFIAGQLGPKGGDAIFQHLIALTADKDPSVQGAAAISLRSFTSKAELRAKIRAALRTLLKHDDDHVRWAALDTLAEAEPAQEAGLVKEVAARLDDPDRSVRNAAVRTLGFTGAAAKPHLHEMIGMFTDDPEVPPFAASRAILQAGPLNVPDLVSLLQQVHASPDVLPLVRLTAHGASAGNRDGEILIGLLGHSRAAAGSVVKPGEIEHAKKLLKDSLATPLLLPKMTQEIEARLAELEKLR